MNNKAITGGLTLKTGGSTGKSKEIVHSWAFNKRVTEAGGYCLKELTPKPIKVVNLLPSGNMNGGFIFVNNICETLNLQVFPIGVANFDSTKEVIERNKVDTLCCVPAYLELLYSNNVLGPDLKHILVIGSLITEDLIKRIKKTLPLVNIQSLAYSTTETGPIGYQCMHLNSYDFHVLEEFVELELLDVNDENEGLIAVTPKFANNEFLVNYNTGDVGKVIKPYCKCGTNAKTLRLYGRFNESIKLILGDTNIHTNMFANDVLNCFKMFFKEINKIEIQVVVSQKEEKLSFNFSVASKYDVIDKTPIIKELENLKALLFVKENQCMGHVRLAFIDYVNFKTNAFMKTPFFLTEF